MDLLIIILLYITLSTIISLGAEKAKTEQRRKAEETNKKEILPIVEPRKMKGEVGMRRGFFDEFPALWDTFEIQLKDKIAIWLTGKIEAPEDPNAKKLSAVYENFGFNYWRCYEGACWVKQLEEVFFETRYFDTIWSLYRYAQLDDQVVSKMEELGLNDANEIYSIIVRPLLEERKQKLMEVFSQMAKELENPLPYTLKIPMDGQETALTLGFQSRYKKRNPRKGMDGYTYSFNGRSYTDVRAFQTEAIENLSEDVSIAKDTFGSMVLRRYTEIPTFDSGDREWDSAEIEFLMFDGRDIHLIVMRGGYSIAHLIFYEKLLTADSRMKPIFKKLRWPVDSITWI